MEGNQTRELPLSSLLLAESRILNVRCHDHLNNCLILGAGRSGTSLTALLLERAGYHVYTNTYIPDDGNPLGYFEDLDMISANEALLKTMYRTPWRRFSRAIRGKPEISNTGAWLLDLDYRRLKDIELTSEHTDKFVSLLSHEPFAYKDPRFSYTLHAIKPLIPTNTVYICVFRDPLQVLESMKKHSLRSKIVLEDKYCFAVWESHYRCILQHHRDTGGRWLFISYQELIAGRALLRLGKFLNVGLDRSLIKTELSRSKANGTVPKHIAQLYQELKSLEAAEAAGSGIGGLSTRECSITATNPVTPEFSIVIPVYNRRDLLSQAIRSCLSQTASNAEIIVSDDCSSEDLRSVVDDFRDPRISYYRNNIRLGATGNHQQAVLRARGEYVLVLNSDDFVLPECLEVAASGLQKRKNAAAAYFSTAYLTGSTIEGFHEMPRVEFADDATFAENPWLEGYHGTSPSCCLFRRAAFDAIGGYRETLRFAYDWDLYMRFMRKGGGVVFIPEVLGVYRKHPDQMGNNRSIDGLLDVLDLWCLPEYCHWQSANIASLVLTHCSDTIRKGGSLRPVLHSLRKYERRQRLWSGLPAALLLKADLFRGRKNDGIDERYRMPNGVEAAIHKARALVQDQTI